MKTQLLRLTSAARALLLLAALLLTLPALRAANALPPEKMSYQGFLVDANGVPLGSNAPVNHVIEFRIYNVSSGGSAIWGEAQTVTIDKGYFSVMLGDGSVLDGVPNGALSTVFSGADASDRFISVKGTSGSLAGSAEILPRLRLVTSPYAYMATTLPPGAITNGLFAAASITGDKLATNTLTAANFSTNVGLWTATNGNVYRASGNVGIGTDTPGGPLEIAANLVSPMLALKQTLNSWASGPTFDAFRYISTSFVPGDGNPKAFNVGAGGVSIGYPNNVPTYGSSHALYVNGNVGIGTTSPGSQLSVGSAVLAEHVNSLGTSFRVNGGNLGNTVGNDVPLGSFIYYPSGGNQVSLGIHARKASATAGWSGTAVGLTLDVDNQPGGGGGIWLYNGNVGIGTTTPNATLEVFGTELAPSLSANNQMMSVRGNPNGIGLNFGHYPGSPYASWIQSQRPADSSVWPLVLNPLGGNVGIGTTTPSAPLEVAGVSSGFNISGASYYAAGGFGNGYALNGFQASIKAGWHIYTSASFYCGSDARIKNVQGLSDNAEDLRKLTQIEITDYLYKDQVAQKSGRQKKVIAQQVEKVFPQAVSKSTDVVPDIFQKAIFTNGWVELATDLKVGERVKLMGENNGGIHEVLEVREGAFRTAFKPTNEKVFVFGREVKDFHNVDYDALSMLNVSATQELARQVKAQETELTGLRAELAKLRTEKKSLAAAVTELQAQDEARESRLARLEQALAKDAKVIQAKATPRLAK